MTNLSADQLSVLTQILDERTRVLRDDLQREAESKEDYDQLAPEVPDPGDAAFAYLTTDMGHAEVARDVMELRAIEAAHARMENGSYGNCVSCGVEIPFERLKAQPTAERCTPCQDLYEKTHGDAMRRTSL